MTMESRIKLLLLVSVLTNLLDFYASLIRSFWISAVLITESDLI